ncbi:MAG: hypothetical protein IT537_03300 [Hyphomicrobiales bacterium]|nr:hypothetical protein [Hyphomicrobiales bacterium]
MLADIGRALYGEHWRRPLADALGVDERQIRRWCNAEYTLAADHGVFRDARALLDRRSGEINGVRVTLERWMKLASRD